MYVERACEIQNLYISRGYAVQNTDGKVNSGNPPSVPGVCLRLQSVQCVCVCVCVSMILLAGLVTYCHD